MPPDHQTIRSINGLDISLYQWGTAPPEFVLAHATGFHARIWDQVIAHLPGRAVAAPDMRGHGLSSKPAPPEPYAWHFFADDLTALADRLDWRGLVGVGHSSGGHAIAHAAALRPGLFRALLLIDPVILPEDMYSQTAVEEHYAAKRRNQWASPDDMFERFKDRSPFNLWDGAVLRDYVDYGLLPDSSGTGDVLACPPAVEAAIYQQSTRTNIYPVLGSIDIPVLVVRLGDKTWFQTGDMLSSPTNPELWTHFRYGRDLCLTDYTHFAPMQNPAHFAHLIETMA